MNRISGSATKGRWKIAVSGTHGGVLCNVRDILSVWKGVGHTLQIMQADGAMLSVALPNTRELDSDFTAVTQAMFEYAATDPTVLTFTVTESLGMPVQTLAFDIDDLRMYVHSEAGITLRVDEATLDVHCSRTWATAIATGIHAAIDTLLMDK